jgi:hypothetical protein
MIEKKLLTIAGVAGILACGACFGPAYRPPAVRPLDGARTIQVTVTNVSETRHLDPGEFAGAIVEKLNGSFHQGMGSGAIHAESGADKSGAADALLTVTIRKESATEVHEPLSAQRFWKVSIAVSATLVAGNGHMLWSDSGITLTDSYPAENGSQAFDWGRMNLTGRGMMVLAYQFQEKMLYVDRP